MAKGGEYSGKRAIRWACIIVAVILSFLGGIATCWFSLDPEFRSLVKTKKVIDELYYEDVSDEKFFGTIFNAINNEILDDYSCYMTADEFKAFTEVGEGKRSGIGLMFLTQDNAGNPQMRIVRVCGNSPAETVGIKTGNYVVGFGASAETITESVDFEAFVAFVNDYDANETFYLKVKESGVLDAPTRVVGISKQVYVENYVFYRTATTAYRFEGADALTLVQKGEPLSCLDEETAYIQLTEFNGNASGEFKKAMNQFRADGMKNLVLDLRGNGGGFLNIMQDISSYFCKNTKNKKPVVAIADYGDYQESFRATGNYYWDYFTAESRICVLADADTASASECLIGSMIDYGAIGYSDICLAERYGKIRTYGKGIMQSTIPLIFGGDAVKVTTAVIRWPVSKNCIHDRGVLPEDGAFSIAEMDNYEDETAASIAKLFS